MNDFSNLNHLPTEIKQLIVEGQLLVEEAKQKLEIHRCDFDLTSKREIKSDIRSVEKCIETISRGKVNEKTVLQLRNAIQKLRTILTGLVSFFTR